MPRGNEYHYDAGDYGRLDEGIWETDEELDDVQERLELSEGGRAVLGSMQEMYEVMESQISGESLHLDSLTVNDLQAIKGYWVGLYHYVTTMQPVIEKELKRKQKEANKPIVIKGERILYGGFKTEKKAREMCELNQTPLNSVDILKDENGKFKVVRKPKK